MKYTRTFVVGVIGPVLCIGAGAAGDTVSIVADRDNTLFEMMGHPDLSSGRGELFSGGIAQQDDFGNGLKRRALLHFPLTSIPAGATITNVTLTMRMTKTISGSYQFNLYRMLADWGEGASNSGVRGDGVAAMSGDATWNYRFYGDPSSAWTTPGGDFSSVISASTMVGNVGSYSWSGPGMVSNVQDWLDGTKPNYGWMMTSNLEFLASIAKRWASRESGTVAFRPTLSVTYTVPGPGVGAGLGMGLLAVAVRRRRGR